ncbi:hypothetical protein SELMODRAFT_410859 [Selaginella moellendorffii]|uniref:Uncharacterized protein n=1 Tax=Selaginella moellendorffii TaxID=88036 RepID=D8RG37_SELML|nr:hypothetical protein SELMODRAFT_410859 [Selaginella moellendorffii]
MARSNKHTGLCLLFLDFSKLLEHMQKGNIYQEYCYPCCEEYGHSAIDLNYLNPTDEDILRYYVIVDVVVIEFKDKDRIILIVALTSMNRQHEDTVVKMTLPHMIIAVQK